MERWPKSSEKASREPREGLGRLIGRYGIRKVTSTWAKVTMI